MDISYIVSACCRPSHLACCLFSIKAQTHRDYEVIVTNNGQTHEERQATSEVVVSLYDHRFRILEGQWPQCYYSSEDGARIAVGEYLCFPSDDSYYVPFFAERMLASNADIIASDQAYSSIKNHPAYYVMNTSPVIGGIDKTGFLVRRSLFNGFPNKEIGETSDGEMIVSLVAAGATWLRINEVLSVHN